MPALINELFDRWNGKPILVIGGGPSVNADLPALVALGITPACVISANDHGAEQTFFPVDIYVNCDKVHCMRKIPMEKILRPLGGIIVNRHSWADYRLADWNLPGNTGITAIALAAILGGDPVLVTGIDMWKGGRIYFHDKAHPKRPRHEKQVRTSVTKRSKAALNPLVRFTAGANVRPLSGPLCEFFKKFSAKEVLPPTKPVAYRRQQAGVKPVLLRAAHSFRFSNLDAVPVGRAIALSPEEAKKYGGLHHRIE